MPKEIHLYSQSICVYYTYMKQLTFVFVLTFVLIVSVYIVQNPKQTTSVPASTVSPITYLTGTIIDAKTNTPIAGVKIAASGNNASTNKEGVFTMPLPIDSYEVVLSKAGYKTETVHITLSSHSQDKVVFPLNKNE